MQTDVARIAAPACVWPRGSSITIETAGARRSAYLRMRCAVTSSGALVRSLVRVYVTGPCGLGRGISGAALQRRFTHVVVRCRIYKQTMEKSL